MSRLILKPSAERDLQRLPQPTRRRIVGKLAQIEANPLMPSSVKLAGTHATYRVRVGDYGIVYQVDDGCQNVFVTIIAHRREVYRGL